MPTLEDAIALALEAHRGSIDKAGAPYILHPLRVMLRLRTVPAMMAGVLHDVLEDTAVTQQDLIERGYPSEVVEALVLLTKREGEEYGQFINRLASNPLARAVKIADLEDNMDVRRLDKIGAEEAERLEKYRQAWSTLMLLG